jgi:hypothetical protein
MSAPIFNYSAIKKRRNNIAAFLTLNYLNVPISGDALHALAAEIMQFFPSTVCVSAVFESIRLLAGTKFDRKRAQEFAWLLAGNVPRLIAGEPVHFWSGQLIDETVPVRIELVTPTRRKKDFGFIFRCRALAGTPCPMQFSQFFSSRSCYIFSRVIGFSPMSWGPYQYAGIAQHFTNLLMFAHIDAALSHGKPVFRNISVSSSMLKANKALLDVRCQQRPCPRGYTHTCAVCPIGYNECSYGVHPKTFVEQSCRVCHAVEFFDPDAAGLMCVKCQSKNRLPAS